MHDALAPNGFSVVAVSLDHSPEPVQRWVEQVRFPVLIDAQRAFAEAYGIVNVPTVVWVDEQDRIVRPHTQEFADDRWIDFHGRASAPHLEALRRWVVGGVTPLEPDEVRAGQRPPTMPEQVARQHFRIAVHLHREGRDEAARPHFDRAAELSPDDWTVRRGAMPLRGQDPFGDAFFALYEDTRRRGVRTWYPGDSERPT